MNTATTLSLAEPRHRLDALRSEGVKLRTLRSTWTTMLTVTAVSIVLAAIVAASQLAQWDDMTAAQRADIDPISASLVGLLFATAIVGALGVRTAAGEFATGMIDVTLTATPSRTTVLIAKAAVVAAIATPVALVTNAAAFVIGQTMFADRDLDVPISDPAAMRAIAYGTITVAAIGVLGVALGTLLRRTAMATTLLAVTIVGSQLFAIALPEAARRYLPGLALQASVTGRRPDDLLAPTAGLMIVVTYTAIGYAVAYAIARAGDR